MRLQLMAEVLIVGLLIGTASFDGQAKSSPGFLSLFPAGLVGSALGGVGGMVAEASIFRESCGSKGQCPDFINYPVRCAGLAFGAAGGVNFGGLLLGSGSSISWTLAGAAGGAIIACGFDYASYNYLRPTIGCYEEHMYWVENSGPSGTPVRPNSPFARAFCWLTGNIRLLLFDLITPALGAVIGYNFGIENQNRSKQHIAGKH